MYYWGIFGGVILFVFLVSLILNPEEKICIVLNVSIVGLEQNGMNLSVS